MKTNNKPIRVGVIGVGRMGQHHCRVYSSIRRAHLVGVFDCDPKAGIGISERYDVDYFSQIDDLLENVDAVSIATPTLTHYDLLMHCLDHGVHALIEKPVIDSLEYAERLLEAVQHSELVVQVGHIERFNPTYQELKNALEDLSILAINFRRLSPFFGSNKDVDVILDLMVHDLDLVLNLTHREPDSFSAYGLKPYTDALDHVVAELWYEEGLLITLTASRITEQKIRSVEVTAKEAYLEADFLNKAISIHRRSLGEYAGQNHGGVKYRQESLIERILVPNSEPLLLEIQHFLECISQNRNPCVTVQDGLNALRLALSIRDLAMEQLLQRAFK